MLVHDMCCHWTPVRLFQHSAQDFMALQGEVQAEIPTLDLCISNLALYQLS
jgi:hypothetical protein